MDLRNPQTQKWLLLALVVIVGAYFWREKVYVHYQEKIDTGYTELEGLETQLKSVEMKFKSLETLKKEYGDLTRRYQTVAQLLPEEDQLSPLLTKIHGAALETSSRVASIEPLPSQSEGFYQKDNYKLTMHSTYHDLGDFLAHLSNLPFIVNVGDVAITTVDERDNPEAATGGFTLTATMTISTYRVKDSDKLVLLDEGMFERSAKE
ncbi:MAG: type 4a pilus biogenesis protein PilO [candidate division Zixibacteria bacterium]|nr:type 4a pilus biogenesis protein PilO [candidate division Zixibacteria bacterium]